MAQYGSGDNAEDSNALPQQTLDNLIGSDGVVTTALEGESVLKVKAKRNMRKRTTLGQALANELVDVNGDADQVLAANDQIANNLLGVCNENTTAPEAECEGVAAT